MKRYYLPPNYRPLTIEERQLEAEAIRWLKSKHLRTNEIRNLSIRNVDQAEMIVTIKREGKLANLHINIGYSDSPLETWMEAFPGVKSNRFIFPAIAYAKRSPQLCVQLCEADVEEILDEKPAKSVLTYKSLCAILRISKVNLHITN